MGRYWIHFPNNPPKSDGYWMMFFDKNSELVEAWIFFLKKYHRGILKGISSLSVSTSEPSPRAFSKNLGVILFHVLPDEERLNILHYGKNLLQQIEYKDPTGRMFYKTREQSYNGCIMTGSRGNHKLWINLNEDL